MKRLFFALTFGLILVAHFAGQQVGSVSVGDPLVTQSEAAQTIPQNASRSRRDGSTSGNLKLKGP